MAKKTYEISLHGCDDSTHIEMSLTDTQAKVLRDVRDRVNDAAQEHCQPSMVVKVAGE